MINKKIKTIITIVLCIAVTLGFAACGSGSQETADNGDTVIFTDSCGRDVEIPANIERVAPAGAVAQMVMMPLAEDKLVGIANEPTDAEVKIVSEKMADMPVFGQFYGSNPNLNEEAILAADPQVIIDVGDMKSTQKEDMDSIQEQTGIPVIFIEASLDKMPDAYRTLGELLGNEEKAEELAGFVEDTLAMAEENSAKIKEQKAVFYGGGPEGLDGNAEGSCQADVIDIIGAKNALVVGEINHAGGGNPVNMEELYNMDPDVILTTEGGSYDKIASSDSWAKLTAVQNGSFYEIPNTPYNWMSQPPSMNRIIGIWWLGNLVYPDVYDYDMVDKTQEFFKIFYNYDLSDDEAADILANSSLK
ncbi:MAG: ABC transporter substrate-binding protein [Bacillota bacterium]|nr:ABC transporter substrate-binding protein [Bacillota bacterium]